MSGIARLLSEDHGRCDDLFAEAENAVAAGDWEAAAQRFAAFSEALSRHVAAEEEGLFPAFEARTGMTSGPTAVMRSEHAQMTGLAGRMHEALTRRDAAEYLGLAETLLMLMRQHNLKEEQILYPMCERALGGDGGLLQDLQRRLHPRP